MKDLLQQILDWSEVWALLIPAMVLFIYKPRAKWIRPLKYYLLVAFIANLLADVIWKRIDLGIDGWMEQHLSFFYDKSGSISNTIFYNIQSVTRFFLFAWFFNCIGTSFKKLNLIIPILFIIMVGVNFTFNEDVRDFSSLLLATEAAVLLLYCLLYYLTMLRDEDFHIKSSPSFWAVTGISIYVVINFPIFLFYTVLSRQAENFAIGIWDVHNISYIVLCLFIAKSFYAAHQQH